MLIPEDKLDDLAEEYRDFQAAPDSELPNYKNDITRIDQFWGELALQTNKVTGKQLYPLLSKIGLAMVIIPNSNADCEITFSMVRARGYKLFSCKTQLSMKFFLLINVKMPTIVGILTFMSGKNNILGLSEPKKKRIS